MRECVCVFVLYLDRSNVYITNLSIVLMYAFSEETCLVFMYVSVCVCVHVCVHIYAHVGGCVHACVPRHSNKKYVPCT